MKVAAPGSKWSRRKTKYVSVRIEVGNYARIGALGRALGKTRGQVVTALLDYYDAGLLEVKKETVPETAKVIPVTFDEETI